MVERQLPKLYVVGSIPIARSNIFFHFGSYVPCELMRAHDLAVPRSSLLRLWPNLQRHLRDLKQIFAA